ncbi:MAG: 16S rRNA (uracil(1498)-N(3))-methyltransferase [Leeuwenhoekiella sp.]
MQLFYNPQLAPEATEIIFDKAESKHIVKVLRKKPGDQLDITNGNGNIFKAEITIASPSKCIAKILEVKTENPLAYHLHLAVAPTKLNDRYETFLEKATEIGLHRVTPIICDHSERKVVKEERYARIIQSAGKQSLKANFPNLDEALPLETFLNDLDEDYDQKFIAHCEESDKFSLKAKLKPAQKTLILIGPEGDFSPAEIDLAKSKGFMPVTLGESRLRTETAAIVAAHSVAFVNEM